MSEIHATLPERYATSMIFGSLGTITLFVLSAWLLVGMTQGSAPVLAWIGIGSANMISILVASVLIRLWVHDRKLMRKPQDNPEGDLA